MSDRINKQLLVTGGAGYIGSHVCRQLAERGYQITVIDNLSTGFADSLINNETLVVGDLADEALLDRVFSEKKFDAVLHFAASIVVPDSVKDPIGYYQNNTANTLKLFKTCVNHGVHKVIFSSTAAVYGTTDKGQVTEEDPVAPENPYGRSKLMDEWILGDFARAYGLSFIILRYFNVAGADPQLRIGQKFPNATHLIKVACEAALGLRPQLVIYGNDYPTPDGTGVRDYIHIEDLASAHVCAYEHLAQGEPTTLTLNCGYGRGFSVLEVIEEFARTNQVSVPYGLGPRRPGDVASVVADSSRLRRLLNWTPKYDSLGAIVRSAYGWERHWQGLKR